METKLIDLLSKTSTKIMEFLMNDEDARQELLEHAYNMTEHFERTPESVTNVIQKAIYTNRFLDTKEMGIIDYYQENNIEISEDEKLLFESFKNYRFSTFKVIKKHKDYLKLSRLTSEVVYEVYPVKKMIELRNVPDGDYIFGAIINFKGKYYLIDIDEILDSSEHGKAMTGAFLEMTLSTEAFHEDSPENFQKAKTAAGKLNEVFIEHFGNQPVITTKDCADSIIDALSLYILENDTETIKNITVEKPEIFGYFEKEEAIEKADDLKIPDHKVIQHDTGLFVDPELGLFKIPYYGTFREIFFTKDPLSIENYHECILTIFEADSAPPSAIMHVYNEVNNREKFLSIIKEPLGYDIPPEIEELLKIYKSDFHKYKRFSFAVINLVSPFVEKLRGELVKFEQKLNKEKEIQSFGKIGRNDSCPCGSGKKFKKCCLKN